MGPLQQDVLDAVRSGNAHTTAEITHVIARRLDVSPDAIRVTISRLVAAGRLRRVRRDWYTTEGCTVFSKTLLLNFRSAVIMMLKAIDAALLEGYGWTPRSPRPDVDRSDILEANSAH